MASKVRTKRATKSIERALTRFGHDDAADILEEVSEKKERFAEAAPVELKPGMTNPETGEKVAYTYKYLCDNFPIVSFTPERTVPLTFNGVRVQAIANVEMHVPEPFKEIYDRSRRSGMNPAQHLKESGYEAIVSLGSGALEPEK